jgi:hypothetical protein
MRALATTPAPGEEVFFATFPLSGLESLESALVFSGRELPSFMAQHCAIILTRPSEGVSMMPDRFKSYHLLDEKY